MVFSQRKLVEDTSTSWTVIGDDVAYDDVDSWWFLYISYLLETMNSDMVNKKSDAPHEPTWKGMNGIKVCTYFKSYVDNIWKCITF
jgi:hypothetical protein